MDGGWAGTHNSGISNYNSVKKNVAQSLKKEAVSDSKEEIKKIFEKPGGKTTIYSDEFKFCVFDLIETGDYIRQTIKKLNIKKGKFQKKEIFYKKVRSDRNIRRIIEKGVPYEKKKGSLSYKIYVEEGNETHTDHCVIEKRFAMKSGRYEKEITYFERIW